MRRYENGTPAPIVVNLAYHPSGVFRFATKDFDFLTVRRFTKLGMGFLSG